MKAMILAAGLGTRLKPWTLHHPKALVPVGGTPMLERVIATLRTQGFDTIVVNVHHFASQIVDFLSARDFGVKTYVSDERVELLDTGGGLLHAEALLGHDEPVLVHNVDILSNAPLSELMEYHRRGEALATLLTSNRQSSRKLVFDAQNRLCGWHNLSTDERRGISAEELTAEHAERAFSGIYVVSPDSFESMRSLGFEGRFPVMDWLLHPEVMPQVRGYNMPQLNLIDIGKPDTLQEADRLFS